MRNFILLCFIVAAFGLNACCPCIFSKTNPELVNTSWTRANTDDAGLTFKVKMDFYSDHYDFLLMEKAEGHTDSMARIDILPGELIIADDADCPGPDARYAWSIEKGVLLLTKISDACEGRFKAIEGRWERGQGFPAKVNGIFDKRSKGPVVNTMNAQDLESWNPQTIKNM